MSLPLPYPGNDPKTIRPGNVYDIDEWRTWLANLDFDVNDVYQIDFHGDNRCTVHSYRPDRPLLKSGHVAALDPVTVTYRTPPPMWT